MFGTGMLYHPCESYCKQQFTRMHSAEVWERQARPMAVTIWISSIKPTQPRAGLAVALK